MSQLKLIIIFILSLPVFAESLPPNTLKIQYNDYIYSKPYCTPDVNDHYFEEQ